MSLWPSGFRRFSAKELTEVRFLLVTPMKTYSLEDVKRAFEAGFKKGQQEQSERDFPDVGFRFDMNSKEYWEEYAKEKKFTV